MKLSTHPPLSPTGLEALASYEHRLCEQEDLTSASMRNDLSNLRHFITWYETERELHLIPYDPSFAVKRVGQEERCPVRTCPGYLVNKYAYVAKLSDVSPHDVRHRFGYRMAESVLLPRLAHIMGHDSLDTTKLYIRERIMMYNKPPGPLPGQR